MIFDVVYIFKENYEKKLSTGYVFFQKIIKFAAIYYGNPKIRNYHPIHD